MGRLKMLVPRVATVDTRTARPPAKTADPHYATPEHKAWREAVINRAGRACQHVDGNGRRCGRSSGRLFADHIRELKDGGAALDLANGMCLCGSHHTEKTAAERARRLGAQWHQNGDGSTTTEPTADVAPDSGSPQW